MSRQYHPDTARDLKMMVTRIGSQMLATENLARVLGMPNASSDRLRLAREVLPDLLHTIDANTKPVAPDDLSGLQAEAGSGQTGATPATYLGGRLIIADDEDDPTPPHGTVRP